MEDGRNVEPVRVKHVVWQEAGTSFVRSVYNLRAVENLFNEASEKRGILTGNGSEMSLTVAEQ